jgi:peptidoglycan/LPS O-acetylase OafA/YrhL
MKKLAYIDGLKGLGALMVYLSHFVFAFYYAAYSLQPEHANTVGGIEITLGKTPLNILYNGNFAVRLFLVVSGFVLCIGYFKTRDKMKLKVGAVKRYFRLAPLILISNMLIVILMYFGCYHNSETAVFTKSLDWFYGFNHFTPSLSEAFYESLIGCFVNGSNDYNGVLWTIPYLFWGALIVYLAAYLLGEISFRYIAYGVMLLVLLRTDFAGIIFGFIICDFWYTQEKWLERYSRYPVIPILIFILGCYFASYPSIGISMEGTIYSILGTPKVVTFHLLGAVLIVAGILGCNSLQKLFGCRPLQYLGKVSYSIYLWHFLVIATFSSWFFGMFKGIVGYQITVFIDFILTTLLVLIISRLSEKYLETLGKYMENRIVKLMVPELNY